MIGDPLKQLEAEMARVYERTAPYRVQIPVGERGPWKVETFEIPRLDLECLRAWRDGRAVAPGWYTRLLHKQHGVVMSDTPAELNDFIPYVRRFSGRVLVTGLGLGVVLQAILRQSGVEHVTVVEGDADVAALTWPVFADNSRCSLAVADAYEWKPPKGARFDHAWHDIWNDLCTENLPLMGKMRRHYKRYVAAGEQHCWGEHYLRRRA